MGLKQMGKGHKLDTRKRKCPKKEELDFSVHMTGAPVTREDIGGHQPLVTKGVHTERSACTQRVGSFIFFCNNYMNT